MVLLAINFDNLHQILQNLYTDMMPLCSQMTGVAKGLAGLGALFYVAYRVWQSLARAEPVDVFPLLRPFALGLCIMFFPTLVLGTLNSVMSPIVKGTHTILESQTFDMNEYRAQKDKLEFEAMKRNPETAYLVDKEAFDNDQLRRVYYEDQGYGDDHSYTITTAPVRLASMGDPILYRSRPVGYDTREVLEELGYSDEEIDTFDADGSVRCYAGAPMPESVLNPSYGLYPANAEEAVQMAAARAAEEEAARAASA